MKNLRNSKTSGISLVALIVTIIVLIILTAAVIVTFMEGGIIEKAKEAVFKSDIRTYQEILAVKNAEKQIELATGNGEGSELNSTEVKDIIPEFKEEYAGMIAISNGEIVLGSVSKEPYSTWLAELGIGLSSEDKKSPIINFKVGDYVEYNPDGEVTSYEIKSDESGYYDMYGIFGSDDVTILKREINWRVLSNSEGRITLISETPIDKIGIGGYFDGKGFVVGPNVLNNVYATLYSGSKGVARNLNVEDINKIMGFDDTDENNWQYWDNWTSFSQIPSGVKTIGDLADVLGVRIVDTSTPESGKQITEYVPKYYNYKGTDYINDQNSKAHDLIFNGQYWLSSQCVRVDIEGSFIAQTCFMLFIVDNDKVTSSANYLYSSENYAEPGVYAGRPIVILNTDVEISDTNTGDGSTAEKAWQIK